MIDRDDYIWATIFAVIAAMPSGFLWWSALFGGIPLGTIICCIVMFILSAVTSFLAWTEGNEENGDYDEPKQ